jgi:hypothetical protein
MSISIYKPNAKNSGSGFSFQVGMSSKNYEPTLFIKSILQSSWNSDKRVGSFKGNLDNPDKNIIVKTNIKFMPWDKKAKKSMKNSNGQYEDQWVEVPAFSVSFVRNGNQSFVIGLEPGETETVSEFLKFYLKTLFSHRFDKQILEIKKSKEKS